MKTYNVELRLLAVANATIEAESEDEAMQKAIDGGIRMDLEDSIENATAEWHINEL